MVAKKKVKKKATKKVVKKAAKKPAKKTSRKISTSNFIKAKKNKTLVNLIRSLIAFVIFLVLYFVTSNYALEMLFGLGALITGAISAAFILIFIGLFLYKKSAKKKR